MVSKTKEPRELARACTWCPNYSIEDAPKPDIVLFPGRARRQGSTTIPGSSPGRRRSSQEAEIAQSVCTGAFVLGKAGLLDGLEVTTFHGAIDSLQQELSRRRR